MKILRFIATCSMPLALALTPAATAQAQTADRADSPEVALFIVVRDELNLGGRVGQTVRGENDRFIYIKEAFAETLDDADFPVSYEFVQYPQRAPEGARELEITLVEWRTINTGEIECRFWATLRQDKMKKEIGIYLGREFPKLVPSSDQFIKSMQIAAQKGLEKLLPDLLEQMEKFDAAMKENE